MCWLGTGRAIQQPEEGRAPGCEGWSTDPVRGVLIGPLTRLGTERLRIQVPVLPLNSLCGLEK